MPVAKNTLDELLAHLEDAFLVCTVWMEARSEHQRTVNPRKAYPIDTALIARHADGRHELIQVCADASDPATAERELRATAERELRADAERELRADADASAALPKASCTVITLHQTGFPKLAPPAKMRVVTAWLLE